jgi:hypothetical protein
VATHEDILADTLKEAVKEAHSRIVFGIGAALFLLLLVIPDWAGKGEKDIKVPLIDVSADRVLVEILAGVAVFISGYMAYIAVSRTRRIMRRLSSVPHLREAVLLYPSIPTIILPLARLSAVALPPLLLLSATVPAMFMAPQGSEKVSGLIFVTLILNVPYILLMRQLWYPLGEVKYTLNALSFDNLAKDGVPAEVLEKLRPLEGKVYPNRDRFLAALRREAGEVKPVKVLRWILLSASEEEEFED